jgi:hypothetical protein
VLNAAVAKHSADFVDRSLPSSSLLMMTVTPGEKPAISRPVGHADPLTALTDDKSEPAGRRGRVKGRPSLERAFRVIAELYPGGVPEPSREPNKNLCRRVGDKLKDDGMPGLSNDTILRAAGRRK